MESIGCFFKRSLLSFDCNLFNFFEDRLVQCSDFKTYPASSDDSLYIILKLKKRPFAALNDCSAATFLPLSDCIYIVHT